MQSCLTKLHKLAQKMRWHRPLQGVCSASAGTRRGYCVSEEQHTKGEDVPELELPACFCASGEAGR